MRKIVSGNILMNFVFLVLFVISNEWALQNGLEETFISLALIYGFIVVVANGFFVTKFCKK